MLREDGWSKVGQVGSHEQWRHPTKPGKVTVAGKSSDEVPPFILSSTLKQAQLEKP